MRTSLAILIGIGLITACQKKNDVGQQPVVNPEIEKQNETNKVQMQATELLSKAKEHFIPIPDQLIDPVQNAELISLGKKLYFETKLSANDKISCNSCHDIARYGVDNESTSPGHKGKRGDRNSPTTFNAALHISQFWDGRAPDVEAQALGPILNPIEMGMPSETAVVNKLKKEFSYVAHFNKAFAGKKETLNYKNIGIAIGAYERTLLTPSRFDDFLKGEITALTAEELKGLNKFIEVGCIGCHNGVGFGGGMYQKIGLVEEYDTKDLGRFKVTKKEEDKKFFKVPSLRNVVYTAPYFHDGSIKTIEETIKTMGKYQLGEILNDEDVNNIKAFLTSLSAKDLPKI